MIFKRKAIIIVIVVLLAYFLPFILQGDRSVIGVHDQLDSSFSHYLILANEGKTLALDPNTPVNGIMSGLERMYFPSGFNFIAILCMLFKPFTAYLINFILVHLVAFFGMYFLLTKHFLPDKEDQTICLIASLAFSLVPFYPVYGLSVAGLPLLLYAFLNLYKRTFSKWDYIIISAFPFYSALFLTGAFSLIGLFLLLLIDTFQTRKLNKILLYGMALYLLFSIIVDYALFYQILFKSNTASHRVEMVFERFDFEKSFEMGVNLFYNLQYHASSPPEFIIPILFLALIIGIAKTHGQTKLLILFFLLNVAISMIHSLYNWNLLQEYLRHVPLLSSFQWDRFYFLSPLFWYIILALSIKTISDGTSSIGYSKLFIVFIITYQFFFLWRDNKDYRTTAYNLFAKEHSGISFKQFYDKDLFKDVKDFIGKDVANYKVASIGLHPTISQVNGFFTIDGYQPNYPLSYKKNFRRLIKHELEKKPALKAYFDEWGSRCYLFAASLYPSTSITKFAGWNPITVNYDFSKEPFADYILSAVELQNPDENHLSFVKSFDRPESQWRIFLYKNLNASPQYYVQKLMDKVGERTRVGVASELEFPENYIDELKGIHKIVPRKDILNSIADFDVILIDGQWNQPYIIENPNQLSYTEAGTHLLNNYWSYDNIVLFVAVPGVTHTPPILFEKGEYELIIDAVSTKVDNITSQVVFSIGDVEITTLFIPSEETRLTIPFKITENVVAPLNLNYINDINARDYWLKDLNIKKIK